MAEETPASDGTRDNRLSILTASGTPLEPTRLTTVILLGASAVAGLIIAAVGLTVGVPQEAVSNLVLGLALGSSLTGGAAVVGLAIVRRRQLFLARMAADGLDDLALLLEDSPEAAMSAVGGEQQAREMLIGAAALKERLVKADAFSEARSLSRSIFRLRSALQEIDGSPAKR